MKNKIRSELEKLEREFDVRVIYACESGSRAWGFPSADSDYDVRFLYLHPTDWYLTVDMERKRDVIELPIDDSLDISGWDLRKALKLYHKSNPPLLEWLGSPIIYQEAYSIAEQMRRLAPAFYNPIACSYHYLRMAENNYRHYLKGESVWVKKYFYVLRPLLAINWLERGLGVVPTEFQKLMETVIDSRSLSEQIERLIEAKRSGHELDHGPRIPIINAFIDSEFARLKDKQFQYDGDKQPFADLNKLFRAALDEVWGE